jgi:hypothetical protein
LAVGGFSSQDVELPQTCQKATGQLQGSIRMRDHFYAANKH